LFCKSKSSDVRNTALQKLLDSRLPKGLLAHNPKLNEGELEEQVLAMRADAAVKKQHLKEIGKISRKIFHSTVHAAA
jgi:hypothetical protein